MTPLAARSQRGATLMVAIIFLSILMVAVAVAFRMSNINLKAVGNMQGQAEAEAAANKAVETALSTATTFTAPASAVVAADEHGVKVSIGKPECIQATPVYVPNSGDPNPQIVIDGVPFTGSGFVDTHWNVKAVAEGEATGAKVEINQGVRLVLPDNPNPCP